MFTQNNKSMDPSGAMFFDLDGTLVDSSSDIKSCLREAFRKASVSIPEFNDRFQIGPPLSAMMDKISPGLTNISKQKIECFFRELYDVSEYPNTNPYPGVCALLKELIPRGIPLFVATNKPLFATQRILKKMGWDFFADVLTPDSNPATHSKADLLVWACQRWNLSPASCWMVGDLPDDIRSAHEARMNSIGITWGYGTERELLAAMPNSSLVTNPKDLLNVIGVTV